MRPKRYPYQGMKKESIAVTIDSKKIITNQINANDIAKLRCEVAVNTSELNNIKRKLSSN